MYHITKESVASLWTNAVTVAELEPFLWENLEVDNRPKEPSLWPYSSSLWYGVQRLDLPTSSRSNMKELGYYCISISLCVCVCARARAYMCVLLSMFFYLSIYLYPFLSFSVCVCCYLCFFYLFIYLYPILYIYIIYIIYSINLSIPTLTLFSVIPQYQPYLLQTIHCCCCSFRGVFQNCSKTQAALLFHISYASLAGRVNYSSYINIIWTTNNYCLVILVLLLVVL